MIIIDDYLILIIIIDNYYHDKINFSSNINEVIRPVLNFLFFFYDKISQVQKSIKTQVQFFIKCRLKVDLVLYNMYFSTLRRQ